MAAVAATADNTVTTRIGEASTLPSHGYPALSPRFGRSQQWGFYGLPAWGSPTLGGPVVTPGGAVFIGASMDSRVRALDAASGEEIWSDLLAAPVVANPAVYTRQGVDYVVFVAGGNSILKDEVADQVVAYRLRGQQRE